MQVDLVFFFLRLYILLSYVSSTSILLVLIFIFILIFLIRLQMVSVCVLKSHPLAQLNWLNSIHLSTTFALREKKGKEKKARKHLSLVLSAHHTDAFICSWNCFLLLLFSIFFSFAPFSYISNAHHSWHFQKAKSIVTLCKTGYTCSLSVTIWKALPGWHEWLNQKRNHKGINEKREREREEYSMTSLLAILFFSGRHLNQSSVSLSLSLSAICFEGSSRSE